MIQPNAQAKAILRFTSYATLATVSEDGEPWNAPVYYAYNSDYAIYWGSHIGSQHSQNIITNGKVFIVVYNSTVAPGQGQGVYIKATCEELTNPEEITYAHGLIQERRNPIPYWKLEQVQSNMPVRLFKAIPEKIWTNDSGENDGQYIDIRIEAEQK